MSEEEQEPDNARNVRRQLEATGYNQQEIAALSLQHCDKHRAAKSLGVIVSTYTGVINEIQKDLAKVDVDIGPSLPFLVRKSTALSVTHDALCCTLLLELILCKRSLSAVRAAPGPDPDNLWTDPTTDQATQRAANKRRTEAEDRLLRRLFTIMEQLRKANKGFFDILPTLEAMGVSRPATKEEKMGPPHPSEISISGEKHVRGSREGVSVVVDSELPFGDAAALAEYRRMLKSRDNWAARQEKLLVPVVEDE